MQLTAVAFVGYFHDIPNERQIYSVIYGEALIHLVFCVLYRRHSQVSEEHIFLQLMFDIGALSWLFYVSGGATNPFVSSLMLPVLLGAVTLSIHWFIPLWLSSVSSYSYMAFSMPAIGEPHILHGHYFGMWVNYMLIITTVSVVVRLLVLNLKKREAAITNYRETQMRKEQLLTLGSVATQMAHELATPIATLTFIHEELQEQCGENELIEAMQEPLFKCHTHIESFRENARQLRAGKTNRITVQQLANTLKSAVAFELPDAKLHMQFIESTSSTLALESDSTLVPAILNLLTNAHQANLDNNQNQIDIYIGSKADRIKILIQDQGKGFNDEQLQTIGKSVQFSETGLGIAAMLSHATIERLGGSLYATNHVQGGALVSIELPLAR